MEDWVPGAGYWVLLKEGGRGDEREGTGCTLCVLYRSFSRNVIYFPPFVPFFSLFAPFIYLASLSSSAPPVTFSERLASTAQHNSAKYQL